MQTRAPKGPGPLLKKGREESINHTVRVSFAAAFSSFGALPWRARLPRLAGPLLADRRGLLSVPSLLDRSRGLAASDSALPAAYTAIFSRSMSSASGFYGARFPSFDLVSFLHVSRTFARSGGLCRSGGLALCLSLTGKAIVPWDNPIIKSRFSTFSCHFYMG